MEIIPNIPIHPLQVSQPTVCKMLDLTPEGLRKLTSKDPDFPKAIKRGNTRQSPIYYDYAELVAWHNAQKQAST